MAVATWVGRFCVADGQVEESGPWLGSLIRQRPDDEADELYTVIEPASENSPEFTSQLVDVIGQLYQRDPLSLTGALQRSLRAAHDHLREWNRKSLKEHRVGAGAGCLAVRGNEAYLAQVGPGVAYVRRASGEFRRYQAEQTGFDGALGVSDLFDPHLRRIPLHPGDLVVVASARIESVVKPDLIEPVMAMDPDDALPEFYRLCRDQENFALVMLSCFEEPDAPPDFLTTRGPQTPADDSTAPMHDAHAPESAGAVALEADLVGAGVAGDAPPQGRASLAAGSVGGGAFAVPRRPAHEEVEEISQTHAPSPPANVRLRGDGAGPRYKKSTGSLPMPQLPHVPRLVVVGAVALLVLGFMLWRFLPGEVQQNREDRFTELIAGAREANAEAQSTPDRALQRTLLGEAQGQLADAEKIHADDGQLLALRADVAAGLADLDAVYEVRNFTPIADLTQQVTGTLAVTRTALSPTDAYFVDAEEGRVLRLPLDGSTPPETVLEQGELAGVMTAGRPAEIVWSQQSGSLIILDDLRQAFAYFPGRGSLPMTVRGADGWGSLDAATASGVNLYVLDVDGAQVWRYLPGEGGFDSERTGLLDAPDLTDATGIAVGQDVYVLDNQAGIRRFSGRSEIPFPLGGIDRPLVSPAALSVLPGSNRILVADRGNKRIVVADPEGVFIRQILSPSFTDLRAAYVDEGTGTLYVLNGDTLLKAPFPP